MISFLVKMERKMETEHYALTADCLQSARNVLCMIFASTRMIGRGTTMVCRVRCSYRWGCVGFRVNQFSTIQVGSIIIIGNTTRIGVQLLGHV